MIEKLPVKRKKELKITFGIRTEIKSPIIVSIWDVLSKFRHKWLKWI